MAQRVPKVLWWGWWPRVPATLPGSRAQRPWPRRGQGSQTMHTGLLNGGDGIAGLFPSLLSFSSDSMVSCRTACLAFEFKSSLFRAAVGATVLVDTLLQALGSLSFFGAIYIQLFITFPNTKIAQGAPSPQREAPAGSVRTNSHPCRTQAETRPQYLGKSEKLW